MKQLSAISSQQSDIPGDTEQAYAPIVDHGEAHRLAIANMTSALVSGDMAAMQKYFDEATYHEQMQREAGIKARQYFLKKVHP